MPVASAPVAAKAVPPVSALYHFRSAPVAVKLATVGVPLQKVRAEAVGAFTVFTVTTKEVLGLSQPFCVCVT